MAVDRRAFIGSIALAAAGTNVCAADDSPAAVNRGNRLAASTYSFWHFRGERTPIETCIDKAADMGFDGVEILEVQMTGDDNAYLQQLKRRAFSYGLDLCGFSTHQSFVFPDADRRQQNIEQTRRSIERAFRLGIPTMRINTGRWGTSKDFDELMKNRGIEPRLAGYSDDDGFGWVIDSIEKLLPKAEECGVVLGLENHWGLGRTPDLEFHQREYERLRAALQQAFEDSKLPETPTGAAALHDLLVRLRLPANRERTKSCSMSEPKLRLVVIRTMDEERLAAFYRCLGMQFAEEQHGNGPRHFAAQLSDVVVEIYPAKAPADVDRTTRVGFSVSDVYCAVKALEAFGAEIVVQPKQTQWGLRAVVKDPDGRAVELYAS